MHKAHASRFSGKGTTACWKAMTNGFVFPSWLQAADIPSIHRYHTFTETEAQSTEYVNKTWLSEKQHKTSKAYQKKMYDISSTKCKHGVHRVLYSHKVPRQKRDTRRVHLLDKKHSRYLRYRRQNLSSRTRAVHQLLLTDFATYTQSL